MKPDDDEYSDAQAAAFYALKALSAIDRVEVIHDFCFHCGSSLREGLATLMPNNQCPCNPVFDE